MTDHNTKSGSLIFVFNLSMKVIVFAVFGTKFKPSYLILYVFIVFKWYIDKGSFRTCKLQVIVSLSFNELHKLKLMINAKYPNVSLNIPRLL